MQTTSENSMFCVELSSLSDVFTLTYSVKGITNIKNKKETG